MPRPRNNQELVVTFAWFSPEQWGALRDISTDKEILERTHKEWANHATVFLADMEEQGFVTQKVPVDVMTMFEWCHAQGKPVNAESRSQYFEHEALRDVWKCVTLS